MTPEISQAVDAAHVALEPHVECDCRDCMKVHNAFKPIYDALSPAQSPPKCTLCGMEWPAFDHDCRCKYSPSGKHVAARSICQYCEKDTGLSPAQDAEGERREYEPQSRSWIACPICGEPDMRHDVDSQGNRLIECTNHACASNGGTNASAWQAARASRPVSRPAAGAVTAWLIECPKGTLFSHTAGFWRGHTENENDLVWSADANDAVRFSRKEDAENTLRIQKHYLNKLGHGGAYDQMYVAEHMWINHPTPTSDERGAVAWMTKEGERIQSIWLQKADAELQLSEWLRDGHDKFHIVPLYTHPAPAMPEAVRRVVEEMRFNTVLDEAPGVDVLRWASEIESAYPKEW